MLLEEETSFKLSNNRQLGTLNIYTLYIYSVMQSDGNSFCGDVVLDNFINASKDENNILDQTYKKQICSFFYYDGF